APLSKRPSVAPPPRLAIPSSAGRASSSSATPRSTRGRIAGGRPCTCSRTSCCRRGRAGASAISSARTCASYWKTSPNISRSWPTGCAACLSKFYNWMCERDDDLVSPVIGVKAPAAENVGERVLDDDELRRLWKACEAIGGREGACIKLLILTGQRRGEISHLRWREVGDDVLELPAPRMKGKRAHTVPLSTQAAGIIGAMPRTGDYVFGRSPVGHFHRIKDRLDERMGNTPKWVIHDVRRTVASGMARIGIAVPVIEKIMAHRKGTFAGVVGVYQRHSFLPEMAAAMQRWGDYVEQLVTGKSAKVVKLRRR